MESQSHSESRGLHIAKLIIILLFGLSIIFPAALQVFKVGLLAILLLVVSLAYYRDETCVRWWVGTFMLAFFFAVVGLIWSLYGQLVGNPGATRVLTVMVAYPILFAFLSGLLKPGDFKKLGVSLKYLLLVLVLSQLVYLLSAYGLDYGFIQSLYERLYGEVAVVDKGEDYLLFTLPSVSSLLFLIPFLTVFILTNKRFELGWFVVLLVAIVVVLLTGRRAFFLSFIISILFILMLIFVSKNRLRMRVSIRLFFLSSIFLVAMGMAISAGFINLDAFVDQLLSSKDFSYDASNIERVNQFLALMGGFVESPLVGQGAGAAASYIRSPEQPWAYELFYVALLFQYGLLGFLVYVMGVLFILYELISLYFVDKITDENRVVILAFLAGLMSFLVATSTNPYLAKFDYMWVLFTPVALINCYKVYDDV